MLGYSIKLNHLFQIIFIRFLKKATIVLCTYIHIYVSITLIVLSIEKWVKKFEEKKKTQNAHLRLILWFFFFLFFFANNFLLRCENSFLLYLLSFGNILYAHLISNAIKLGVRSISLSFELCIKGYFLNQNFVHISPKIFPRRYSWIMKHFAFFWRQQCTYTELLHEFLLVFVDNFLG